jgi:hypothetical protein
VQAAIPAGLDPADPVASASVGIASYLSAVRANPDTWKLLLAADQLTDAALAQMARGRAQLVAQLALLAEAGLAERRSGPLDSELVARLLLAAGNAGAQLVLQDPEAYHQERLVSFLTEVVRCIQDG